MEEKPDTTIDMEYRDLLSGCHVFSPSFSNSIKKMEKHDILKTCQSGAMAG
jgi:hypothetical protein